MLKLNIKKLEFEKNRLGWSYGKIADTAGISRQLLSYIMKQRSLSQADKIAEAIQVDVKDLIVNE